MKPKISFLMMIFSLSVLMFLLTSTTNCKDPCPPTPVVGDFKPPPHPEDNDASRWKELKDLEIVTYEK